MDKRIALVPTPAAGHAHRTPRPWQPVGGSGHCWPAVATGRPGFLWVAGMAEKNTDKDSEKETNEVSGGG